MPEGPPRPFVVFDLDGTLIDSVPLIVASHRHAVQTVLGRDLPDAVLAQGIGTPLIDQMRAFDAARAEELFDAYRAWNLANTARLLRAFDGVDELLVELERAGAGLAIVTSKMRDAVELAFSVLPPAVEFGAVVTLDDTDRHKPDPTPILLALERLGASPEHAVYVGDAPTDIEAGLRAGVQAVGVTWGAADRERLAAAGADAIAGDVAALRSILLGR